MKCDFCLLNCYVIDYYVRILRNVIYVNTINILIEFTCIYIFFFISDSDRKRSLPINYSNRY